MRDEQCSLGPIIRNGVFDHARGPRQGVHTLVRLLDDLAIGRDPQTAVNAFEGDTEDLTVGVTNLFLAGGNYFEIRIVVETEEINQVASLFPGLLLDQGWGDRLYFSAHEHESLLAID